ncbi:hypothetical protein ARAM_000071 [Aspergillus rambellii]|uniref:Membrane anchor Opy2 N-terminal domain-containing protein n=1 Tax=Aspergillus rambellii TaxID=308745 RepID=A0A0F8W981_9EURO|nr:hypothetical protein ARAM_000071 [Aspergillus rambellii]
MSSTFADPFFHPALVARDSLTECVKCPSTAPTCPSCPSGTKCNMVSQSCNQCATMECISDGSSGSSQQNNSGGGSNAGAIAGGVVGGVACIALVTFLIWWFVIRKKRKALDQERSEKASSFAEARDARKSTHSIASTVLTRASNVIQIAYIPGVTNRSPPETPGALVPPVPPLPGASPDQHFFMPGDLRDSSWSDVAPSLRSSVATTIYRNNAIVSPMPAQQIMRTRAAVVSIHNGGNGQPASQSSLAPDAPAVPVITQAQLTKAGITDANSKSSIVARTVTAKPVMVKGSGKKNNAPAVQTIQEQVEPVSGEAPSRQKSPLQNTTSAFDASSSDEEEAAVASTSNKRNSTLTDKRSSAIQSQAPTVIEDSPAVDQSPFKDQTPTDTIPRNSSFLEAHEGSTRSNRNSRTPPPRVESPFSDANEVK